MCRNHLKHVGGVFIHNQGPEQFFQWIKELETELTEGYARVKEAST